MKMDTNTADIIASCGAQVIPMNEDTWRIEDGEVRFFLLKGTEKALLIDTGMTIRQPKEIASALTDLPVMLLNTHADRDHIGGNDQFESFYMNPADEAQYSASGKGGRIIPVRDGDEIDLGNRKLRIIHLPGHTPGSIAVLDVSRRVLLSGDPIQEYGRIFTGTWRIISEASRSWKRWLAASMKSGLPMRIFRFSLTVSRDFVKRLKGFWVRKSRGMKQSSLGRRSWSMIWDSRPSCVTNEGQEYQSDVWARCFMGPP